MIIDQFGRSLLPKRKDSRGGNPTLFLTPKALQQHLSAFDRGHIAPLSRVMQWVEEHDATTASVAGKAAKSVTRHGWDLIKKKNISSDQNILAEQQQKTLQRFFDNIEVRCAEDEDEIGGVRLLLQQMMSAFGRRYSIHHLVWQPGDRDLNLKTIHVPTWFFENSSGRMRFIGSNGSLNDSISLNDLGGETAWMINKGSGVSIAGIACWMFANISLLDWVTYCSRHGMPGFVGKSNSNPSSSEWSSMVDAVYNIASEFSAVVSANDAIEVLDLTANGEAPYAPLVEVMHRLITVLWRGADLSTFSKAASVGASVQDDETAAMDEDNAEWLSETINRHITRRVIDWYFGASSEQLVNFEVRTARRDDQHLSLKVFSELSDRGAEIPMSHINERFQIPERGEGEKVLGHKANSQQSLDVRSVNTSSLNTQANSDLLENALAELVGVSPETLSPAADVMQSLSKLAADEDLTYESFLESAEELFLTLPEFFNPSNTILLIEALEASLGAAAVQGIRESLSNE